MLDSMIFTARVRSTREGYVFSLSVHQKGTPWSLVPSSFLGVIRSVARAYPWTEEGYPQRGHGGSPNRTGSTSLSGQATLRAVRLLRSRRRTFLFIIEKMPNLCLNNDLLQTHRKKLQNATVKLRTCYLHKTFNLQFSSRPNKMQSTPIKETLVESETPFTLYSFIHFIIK